MGIQIPQNCADCSHANICPDRANFEALQQYTDLLVKSPALSGDGVVRTSIRVRVEYRYANGPALEDIYKSLGMEGWGQVPCGAPGHRTCPLMRRFPFDNPIYAPFPHVVDTVTDHICRSSHNDHGRKIPYFMETIHNGRLGNCHVSHYSGKNWWSCRACKVRGRTDPSFDFAQLGGSIYSVFHTEVIEGAIGDTIQLKDLPIPKNVSPDYAPSAIANKPAYTLESEEIPIIIYYEYIGLPEPVLPSEIPTAPVITTKVGVVNNSNFIYYANEVDTGEIIMVLRHAIFNGCRKDYNRVIFNNMVHHGVNATYNIGEFQAGTRLTIEFIMGNRNWMPIASVMKMLMNEPTLQFKELTLTNHRHDTARTAYAMTFTVREGGPIIIRPAFMRRDLCANYLNIGKYWHFPSEDDAGMIWAPWATTVEKKIPNVFFDPIWSKANQSLTYPGYLPPADLIDRHFFDLRGYTDEMKKRADFEPVTLMSEDMEYTEKPFDVIHWYGFTEQDVNDETKSIGAMWSIAHSVLSFHLRGALLQYTDGSFDDGLSICKEEEADTIHTAPIRLRTTYQPQLASFYRERIVHAIPTGFNAYVVPIEKKSEDGAKLFQGVEIHSQYPRCSDPFGNYPEAIPDSAFIPEVQERFQPDDPDAPPYFNTRDVTPLDEWDPTTMDLLDYDRILLLLIPTAENQIGLAGTMPNYFCMEIFLSWIPVETRTIFYQRGSDLQVDQGLKNVIHPDLLIGHSFTDVFPEDADGLILVAESDEEHAPVRLGGEKAPFYKLLPSADVELVEDVTIEGRIDGCDDCEPFDTTTLMIPYRDTANIEIVAPAKKSLVRITATVWNGREVEPQEGTIMILSDGVETAGDEVINDTDFEVWGLNGNGTYQVKVSNIHTRILLRTYWVSTEFIAKNTTCERCDGFVDASAYPHITWTPTCDNFSA